MKGRAFGNGDFIFTRKIDLFSNSFVPYYHARLEPSMRALGFMLYVSMCIHYSISTTVLKDK